MINLIPNSEKKKKMRDFYYRLFVVFIAALGFCALVGVVSVLPTFFLSSIEKNLALAELAAQKNQPADEMDQDITATVADLNKKLSTAERTSKGTYALSQKVINQIAVRKMSDIKITQIAYENTEQSGKKVSISGRAPSRERLLLFRRALEDSSAFKQVDLPISNFVKGSNIGFSLSLIPF